MKKFILLCLLSALPFLGFGGDVYDEIVEAIRSGNSARVSGFFAPTVDLAILGQENMYSKAQAELILKDFFSKNPPGKFSFLHKGVSKDGSTYAIWNYESSPGKSYRTYFLIKQDSGKGLIQELRFEKN